MASRDFLGGFGREAGAQDDKAGSAAGGESDDIELSLGLSLGGCFGTDPTGDANKQRLARSSSIASICTLPDVGSEDLATAEPAPPLLHRTSSLPTEYDEARFQRKAMQCQRRLAAKRKRLERRNSMNSSRSSAGASSASRDDNQEPTGGFQLRRTSSSLPEQAGSGSGGASAMNTSSDHSSGQTHNNNSGSSSSSLPPTPSSGPARPPNSSGGGAREQQQHPAPPPLRTLRSLTMRTASTGDFRRTMMEEMPMVFSRLDGPNARRVDGFLYKFGKANDVRIVCVCHGNFLTPAEFVGHAGGGVEDLAHPLRHIIINQQPSEFL